jgi:hypothetical protein
MISAQKTTQLATQLHIELVHIETYFVAKVSEIEVGFKV